MHRGFSILAFLGHSKSFLPAFKAPSIGVQKPFPGHFSFKVSVAILPSGVGTLECLLRQAHLGWLSFCIPVLTQTCLKFTPSLEPERQPERSEITPQTPRSRGPRLDPARPWAKILREILSQKEGWWRRGGTGICFNAQHRDDASRPCRALDSRSNAKAGTGLFSEGRDRNAEMVSLAPQKNAFAFTVPPFAHFFDVF